MPETHTSTDDLLTLEVRGTLEDVQHHPPTEDRRRPVRRFAPARPNFGRRRDDDPADPEIAEAPGRVSVLHRERLYRRLLGMADGVAAYVAVWLCASVFGDDRVTLGTLVALPIVVVIHKIAGLYERDELVLKRSTLDEAPVLFQIAGLFALLTWLLGDHIIDGELQPQQVLGLWGFVFAGTLSARSAARAIANHGSTTERCLVIGSAEAGDRIREKMRESNVKADVVATLPLSEGHRLTLARGTEHFSRLVEELEVDRVILAPVSTDSADMLELIRIAKLVGVRVSLLPRMLEVVGTSVEFDHLDGLAMLGVRRFGLTRSSRLVKRGFDLLGAGLGLLAILPLFVVIGAAIRLDSRGGIFFSQTRVGRDGQRFRMIKFRSMAEDAERRKAELLHLNEGDGHFKITDDPRITRVGGFLRRTSLDELPQLLNVLRGEMSLVGPRPLITDEDAKIEGTLRSRLHLTPGMTGPWQVLGSSRIPMDEMVKIDYLYVANWSLWSDVKLLLRTVPHMLARGGR